MSRVCVRSSPSGVTDASPSRTALQSEPGQIRRVLLGAADPVVGPAAQILPDVDLIAVDAPAEERHAVAAYRAGGEVHAQQRARRAARPSPRRMISCASARANAAACEKSCGPPALQRHGERRDAAQRALDRARDRPRIEDVRAEVEAVVDARHHQRRPPRHQVQQRQVDAVDRRAVDRDTSRLRSRRPATADRARSSARRRCARDRARATIDVARTRAARPRPHGSPARARRRHW